jgi:hypothetical protein
MQSTLNVGGKVKIFLIFDNITKVGQIIGSVTDVLSRIVALDQYASRSF